MKYPMKRAGLFVVLAMAALMVPSSAFAQGGGGDKLASDWTSGFGTAGTVTVMGDLSFNTRTVKQKTEFSGGGLSTSSETVVTKQTSFGASPIVQFFVIDGLAIGGGLTYSHNSAWPTRDGKTTVVNNTIGPEARVSYYFPIFPNGTVFADGGVGFLVRDGKTVNQDGDDNPSPDSHQGIGFDVGAGLSYAFGAQGGGFIGLKVGYQYENLTEKYSNNGATRKISDIDSGLFLGTRIGAYF